ncbi:hypothetical protein EAH84_14210 [Sphingomonas oligophenolica]|uniref:Uncharacterized protein n=1 Tax=Sphingomonas oligophenolica TaxID=301154 RepID=A0A502C5N5_9SPHN|nr:hypothetical protein EAH84_14210 [Sphingomonas oligophenolica]
MPEELLAMADAIYWKALSGFDFSAYALMLRAVAERSSGADLYLQNDSVLGPFADVDELLARAPWDLSGFMGSAALENHIQSYAFLVRGVDDATVDRLASVMSTRWACNRWRDVVNLQETRFARVAAVGMSVGALWFAPRAGDGEIGLATAMKRKLARSSTKPVIADVRDPTLVAGLELVSAGFPFLKKSLFGRNRALQDANALAAFLAAQAHPPVIEGANDAGR